MGSGPGQGRAIGSRSGQRLPGRTVSSFRSPTGPAASRRPVPAGAGLRGRCLPDGLLGGLAGLRGAVGQDARLPALAGARPLALRSGLHRVGSARRVGVAPRRQLGLPGLGRPRAARLLHPGDAEQAQGEAQGDAHRHGPCGPQHRQQQRCPHGARTAGPQPGSSPGAAGEAPRGRDRGGGGPGGPGPSGGRAPAPRSRARGPSRIPGAALLSASGRRAAPRRVAACGAEASAAAPAVRRVTARAPPPGWGLGLRLPEREEKGRLKAKDPRKCPLLGERAGDAGAEPPPPPGAVGAPRVTSEAARPAWRVRPSDVRSRGRSCPSAPKAAGGLRAWGRGSGAARAPARAPSPSPGPARGPGRRGTGAPAGAGGGAAAATTRRDRSLRPSGPLPRTTGFPRAAGSRGLWRPATPDPSASAQPLSLKSSGRLQPR